VGNYLESVRRIRCGGRTDVGFQTFAIDDIDGSVKEAGDMLLKPDIILDGDVGLGIDFDHDVGVAVGSIVASRSRAKQRCTRHAARAQVTLVLPETVKNLLFVQR
jgi:hypothetical protein